MTKRAASGRWEGELRASHVLRFFMGLGDVHRSKCDDTFCYDVEVIHDAGCLGTRIWWYGVLIVADESKAQHRLHI